MSELPDRFPVEVVDWEDAYDCCRRVRDEVRRDGYEPDAIVGIARGGWFPARCLSDALDVPDLTSIKVENYVGDRDGDPEPAVRYDPDPTSIAGKDVLLVDDSTDTGGTLDCALTEVRSHDPASVRVAVLQEIAPETGLSVDYAAEQYPEWRFFVNPWEYVENMVDMVNGVLVKADPGVVTVADVYDLLAAYHDVGRAEFESDHFGRIEEVMAELRVRGVVAERADGWELRPAGRERYRNL